MNDELRTALQRRTVALSLSLILPLTALAALAAPALADAPSHAASEVRAAPASETPPLAVPVSFTIQKEQKIEGEPGYTQNKLTAKLGQTADYKITVRDTGGTELTFAPLRDGNCTNISPTGTVTLSGGGSVVYTCERKNLPVGTTSNIATITGDERFEEIPELGTLTAPLSGFGGAAVGVRPDELVLNESTRSSNKVEVEVPAEPAFTIEKEQKIEGEAAYTKSKLTAKLGQTVDYKITVKNTGNVELSLSALVDPKCENIVPLGLVSIALGASRTYTCEHENLAVGTYANTASVANGLEVAKESNKVEVEVPAEPAFTIEKEQKIEGEGAFTKSKLTAKLGQTVDYKITVKNTGNVELTLGALNDAKCETIAPSGEVKLAVGASQTYTCEHKGLAVGSYTNAATIANSAEAAKESNKVEVEVLAEPLFTIEKEQKIEGEGAFTKSKLTAKLGQTVDYKITVKNTGNVELNLSALVDPKCEGVAPSVAVKLALNAIQTYTCEHKNLAVGTYANTASVANGLEVAKESNKVEVEVLAEPLFTIEKEQKIEGEGAFTKSKLTAKLGQTVDYKITVKNTGNVELNLSALVDPKCEGVAPSVAVKLALNAIQTYTCEHKNLAVGTYANTASVANGLEVAKESNKVEVEVPAEPAFTIEKEQKIEGEGAFTKSKLTAKLGQTADYKITVKNTGNVELTLGALNDAKCETIAPSGAVKLAVGASQTYTCEHRGLAVGSYTNAATITNGAEAAKESNKVEVEVPAEPAFTIEKEQKIEGEGAFTKSKLTAKLGQTADYKITVKNTGNVELTLSALNDAKCETIAPSGAVKLAVGASQTYTCEHRGLAVGSYTNAATITNGAEAAKESNGVEVEVPAQPSFTIELEQKLEGEANYTKGELTAKAGQTVDYKITVTNTGNVELSFKPLNDSPCENIAPSAAIQLATGASQSYTCEHKNLAPGTYANVATITDPTEDKEETKESNRVELEATAEPAPVEEYAEIPRREVKATCAVSESSIQLHGVEGEHQSRFQVWVNSIGIKKITFLIDGKKYKSLKRSKAAKGRYAVVIDPRHYGYGMHEVSIKTVMSDRNCGPISRAASFVRPKPTEKPLFTG